MAVYLSNNDQDARVATSLYAAAFEAMGLSFAAIFAYTLRAGRTVARCRPRRSGQPGSVLAQPGGHLLAIGIAFVSAPRALAIIGHAKALERRSRKAALPQTCHLTDVSARGRMGARFAYLDTVPRSVDSRSNH